MFIDHHLYLTKITLLPWWSLWIFLLHKYQCTMWITLTCTPKWHINWFPLKLNVAISIILAGTIQKSQLNNYSLVAIFRRKSWKNYSMRDNQFKKPPSTLVSFSATNFYVLSLQCREILSFNIRQIFNSSPSLQFSNRIFLVKSYEICT